MNCDKSGLDDTLLGGGIPVEYSALKIIRDSAKCENSLLARGHYAQYFSR